jgi:hypothetical protein
LLAVALEKKKLVEFVQWLQGQLPELFQKYMDLVAPLVKIHVPEKKAVMPDFSVRQMQIELSVHPGGVNFIEEDACRAEIENRYQ